MRTKLAWLPAACAALLLAACATTGGKADKLNEAQYAWSAAIRWGDFEGAWNLVDPAYREAHPMSSVEFERYRQIQVSAYHDGGSQTLPDGTVARPVELGIVNRNTMQERTARYTEQWRYDEAAKTWWNTAGLPDLWSGQ